MSHYNVIKTELRDKDCLIKALERKGFKNKIQINEEATNLEGYEGKKRQQTAEIIIPRKYVGGAANDIGFKLKEDGSYEAIISDYDRGRYDDKWLKELETEYGIERAKEAFELAGWQWEETKNDAGEVQLVGTMF